MAVLSPRSRWLTERRINAGRHYLQPVPQGSTYGHAAAAAWRQCAAARSRPLLPQVRAAKRISCRVCCAPGRNSYGVLVARCRATLRGLVARCKGGATKSLQNALAVAVKRARAARCLPLSQRAALHSALACHCRLAVLCDWCTIYRSVYPAFEPRYAPDHCPAADKRLCEPHGIAAGP